MNQYIITDELLDEIGKYSPSTASKIRFYNISHPYNPQAVPDLSHITPERRGCLTCLAPDCPVWQAADQVCWKPMPAERIPPITNHKLCEMCSNQERKAEREKTINEFYLRLKVERDPTFDGVSWDDVDAVFIKLRQVKK